MKSKPMPFLPFTKKLILSFLILFLSPAIHSFPPLLSRTFFLSFFVSYIHTQCFVSKSYGCICRIHSSCCQAKRIPLCACTMIDSTHTHTCCHTVCKHAITQDPSPVLCFSFTNHILPNQHPSNYLLILSRNVSICLHLSVLNIC